jgi:hypothetical protein
MVLRRPSALLGGHWRLTAPDVTDAPVVITAPDPVEQVFRGVLGVGDPEDR